MKKIINFFMKKIFILFLCICAPTVCIGESEKRYVIDYSGTLTGGQIEELNDRALSISAKHDLNVGFLLSKRNYATGETLYGFVKECYRENFGNGTHGFIFAWDMERKVWILYGNDLITRTAVPDKKGDEFWDVFQTNSTEKSYYDGISAYLDAADSYLTKVKAKKQIKRITFSENILYNYVGITFCILLLLLIAMTILSKLWEIRTKKFVSIRVQKQRNNYRTITMLALFPCMVFFLSLVTSTIFTTIKYDSIYVETSFIDLQFIIWGNLFCILWFVVAYYKHENMICSATGAKPLERRENKRVYNLVENLCMATNMAMPKINVIEEESLNAFASGINRQSYTVTLSRGIIDKLDDAELEAVIAHELSHIKNNDAKVMIVSIIFVGIFSFLGQASILVLLSKYIWRSKNIFIAVGILFFCVFVIIPGYLITLVMRSSISRNREYMADAGSAEITRNPLALASALRKISADPFIGAVKRKDLAQLFVHNPLVNKGKSKKSLFATHPPIEKRIEMLEQF